MSIRSLVFSGRWAVTVARGLNSGVEVWVKFGIDFFLNEAIHKLQCFFKYESIRRLCNSLFDGAFIWLH